MDGNESDENVTSVELLSPGDDSGEESLPLVIVGHDQHNNHHHHQNLNHPHNLRNNRNGSNVEQEMQERVSRDREMQESRFSDRRTAASLDPQPLPPPRRRQSPPPPAQDLLRSGTTRALSSSFSPTAVAAATTPTTTTTTSSSNPTRVTASLSRVPSSIGNDSKVEACSQDALRRQAQPSSSQQQPQAQPPVQHHPSSSPRRSSTHNDTGLHLPTRRSASLDNYEYSQNNYHHVPRNIRDETNRLRSLEGRVWGAGGTDNNNNNNNILHNYSSLPRIADPEETNEDEFLSFSIDDAVDAEHDRDDPGPVSGWSVVEVSQEPGAGVPPAARSLHAATLLNGSMFVFGGFDGQTRVNSFFAFSFIGRRWSPVLPAANSGPPPSARDRHIAVAFGNSIYIHGGFDGTSRVSDFWAFDFSTMTWREVVALQGTPPSARHSHCAAVMNHSLYIACGYDGSYKSDIYQFDFTLSRWSAIRATGRRPRARYRATLNAVRRPTPCLILHGGHDGTRHLADTHVFDLETQEWSSLAVDGVPPIPRDSHVSVVHGSSIYVFGGSSGAALNDLHELQLPSSKHQAARWRPVNTGRGTQPQPRFCHAAVVYQDTMYSFGGYSGSERINEFIKFDFALYDLTFEVPPSCIHNDLRSMVNNPTLSDVIFVVEGRDIYAHKLMLIRCEYFQSLFLGNMMESKLSRVPIEQVSYSVFLSLLEYLYTDHVRVPLNSAMELFEAADLFMIPRLKTICEKRMLQSISVSNAASIFYAADMHSAMALRQKAKKYILSHFGEVSKTSSFEEMGRGNIDLVFELLRTL